MFAGHILGIEKMRDALALERRVSQRLGIDLHERGGTEVVRAQVLALWNTTTQASGCGAAEMRFVGRGDEMGRGVR